MQKFNICFSFLVNLTNYFATLFISIEQSFNFLQWKTILQQLIKKLKMRKFLILEIFDFLLTLKEHKLAM